MIIKIDIQIYNKEKAEKAESLGIKYDETLYSELIIKSNLIEGYYISSDNSEIVFYACATSFVCKNTPENIHKLNTAMQ